jgi:hypothetical protein
MSKMRFGDKAKKETTEPETGDTTASDSQVATRPETDGTVARPLPKTGFTGAWDRKDVRLPRINLIHKTSKLEAISEFGIGAFSFGLEGNKVKLGDGVAPITITIIRAGKDYQQKLAFENPDQPAVFPTPEAVEQAGGTLDYSKAAVAEKIYFGPRAHLQVVVACPEGVDDSLFPYEFEGVNFGMGMLTVFSSAYTSVAKELATLCDNNKVMQKGMEYGSLQLTSKLMPHPKNPWHVPTIKYQGENPSNLVAFFVSLL